MTTEQWNEVVKALSHHQKMVQETYVLEESLKDSKERVHKAAYDVAKVLQEAGVQGGLIVMRDGAFRITYEPEAILKWSPVGAVGEGVWGFDHVVGYEAVSIPVTGRVFTEASTGEVVT